MQNEKIQKDHFNKQNFVSKVSKKKNSLESKENKNLSKDQIQRLFLLLQIMRNKYYRLLLKTKRCLKQDSFWSNKCMRDNYYIQ